MGGLCCGCLVRASSVLDRVFWFFGFVTVEYKDRAVRLRGPTRKFYPVFVLLFMIATRIERMINDSFVVEDKKALAPKLTYIALKNFEAASAFFALLSGGFRFDKEKLEVYENLFEVDKLLNVKVDRYNYAIAKTAVVMMFYIFMTLVYNTSDFFRWEKGISQWVLMSKMVTMDLVFLLFAKDIYMNLLRLQVMNTCLCQIGKSDPSYDDKNNIDFRRNYIIVKSSFDKRPEGLFIDDKPPPNISDLIRSYCFLSRNIVLLGNITGATFSLVSMAGFFTIITVLNVYIKSGTYPETNDLWTFVSLLMWFMKYVLYVFFASLCSEVMALEAKRTNQLIGKISLLQHSDETQLQELSKLKRIVDRKTLRVYVGSLFPYDFSFVSGMVAATLSYAIILIQMNS